MTPAAWAAHLRREAERWQPHSAAVAAALRSVACQDARETRFTAGSAAVGASGAVMQARHKRSGSAPIVEAICHK